MFAWIRNLRNTPSTRCPARPAALGFEPLEVREVPALLGLNLHTALNLGGTTVTAGLGASVSLPGTGGPLISLGGTQVSVGPSQQPTTPPATTPPATTPPATTPTGTAVISGQVRYSLYGGDEVGAVANATVILTDAAGNVVASTTTDSSGNYSLGSLPAGSYTLSIASPDYGSQDRAMTIADGSTNTENFTLAS